VLARIGRTATAGSQHRSSGATPPATPPAGGALARLLPAFRLGLGGPIGHGRQWMSWIGVDDVVGIVMHALASEELAGPVNTVAPNPVPNREFAATLGHVLGRPAILPVPAPALRLVFGIVH
jgi:NAD dependent epimerase/dehydratase family enzyme